MRKLNRGFTLIELLVVVGILGILAVAALVAINPAEAQRKTRDATRLKDMGTLQAALEQYVNDSTGAAMAGFPVPAATADLTVTSTAGTVACAANWTVLNLCNYIQQVPRDPLNRSASVLGAGAAGSNARVTANAFYTLVKGRGGQYKICTRLESETNRAKLNNLNNAILQPGAVTATGFAIGSLLTLTCGF